MTPTLDERREYEDEQHEERELFYVVRDGMLVQATFVNVYAIERRFGGREEGGWWFDTGEPVLSVAVEDSSDVADRVRRELEERYPVTKKRYSVLGGEDWNVQIEPHPAREWPESRPHYE